MRIEGKSVLMTGGASGLGAATAKRLAALGARVVIADLNEAAGQALAREVEGAVFVKTDVTNEGSVQNAVDSATRPGPLGVLVNCAGIGVAAKLLSHEGPHPLDLFRKTLEVNLVGTFNALRLAAWAMAQNAPDADGERGIIVNTGLVAAFEGQIGQAAYSASKGGVASLVLPAARELARYGIRVVAIAPGIFETPMLRGLPEAALASLIGQVPFPRRLGRPEEYAALVQHVVENPMLNGTTIRLDGALRMGHR
ncbi:MAG: 3-hydroxyacyl-CoA dehydrogenase [candidate division GAL15 bacterium]